MAPGGYAYRPCTCGMTACRCADSPPVVIYGNSYAPPKRADILELEETTIGLRRELAALRAEVFRLRNQRKR